ncbi:molybdopterin-dependent oxidoreductase [Bacillaceae bacterium S4-13-58]
MRQRNLIWIHNIHLVFVIALLGTGLSLYFQPLRTQLTEWGFPTVLFHLYVSYIYIVFGMIAIFFSYTYAKKRPPLKKFNVGLNIILFGLWTLSGLFMNFGVKLSLPPVIRNYSVIVHDWSTFVAVPWILFHGFGHLLKKRLPWPSWWRGKAKKPVWVLDFKPERREFIKSGIIFIFALMTGGLLKYLSQRITVLEEVAKRKGYFRIYNVTDEIPQYQSELGWKLQIDGEVNRPMTLNMRDMRNIPWQSIVDDFHCVTGWSVKGVELRGVYVNDLFKNLEIQPKGQYATIYSADMHYYDSFTLDQLLQEEAMLVFEMDGKPLKEAQGFPCRLYHPNMYGYKSVKWVNQITFTKDREIGYWQQGGNYDLNGYL